MDKPGTTRTRAIRFGEAAFQSLIDDLRQPQAADVGTLISFSGARKPQMRLAAKALASALGKPLHEVNAPGAGGRYIGETEKNLQHLLERASTAGWILFFDEADALFGKRTGVKDAHDRYANQETSYLLARLEKHPVIAILATNARTDDDGRSRPLRRLVVKFPPY